MANSGTAYFDSKGHFFKTPEEATTSDLAAILGRVGDGESLAPGIAKTLFQRRIEIERIFADHDEMLRSRRSLESRVGTVVVDGGGNVAPIRSAS
jgi:hypothetical protein